MNKKTFMQHRLLSVRVLLICAITLPVSAFGDSDSDSRWGRPSSACERTAGKMFNACLHDTRDDLNETIANCLNIANSRERKECRLDAREARKEEVETCYDIRDARINACEVLDEERYALDPLLDPALAFIDPDEVPGTYPVNPYVSVASGHTYVLRAGEEGEETVVVHVTDESREILGIACRIVVDIVVEVAEEDGEIEYEAVEVTDDWFAQDMTGDVFYCGEVARNFEDGILRDLDGSFEAGIDFAKSGVLIRAFPMSGEAHRQEFALGEAEDIVQYVDLATAPTAEEGGDNPAFPCSPDLCLKTFDFAPLEPESTEFKYYLPGTGFVLAAAMEDGELTGEREELVCIGDTLEILEDPACEIADPEALQEELCKLAPETFCED